jgi:hypothetical protein
MKTLFLFLSIILLINPVHAQKNYMEINCKYPNAKIYQKGAITLNVKDLILINDTLMQYNLSESSGSLKTTNISPSKISYVSVKKGSHAAVYGAVGGLSCLAGALLGVAQVKNDPYYDEESYGNPTGIVVGITAGGAAIGAIIGACIPKWIVLYIPEKKNTYSFGISPNINPNYCGLGLKISF